METGEMIKKIKAAIKTNDQAAVDRICWERLRDSAESASGEYRGRVAVDLLRLARNLMAF